GKRYTYHIKATNSSGGSTFGADIETITLPAAPTSLSATAASQSALDLSWTDNSNGEDGYLVQVSDSGGWREIGKTGANATMFTLDSLAPSTSYTVRVLACNASGNSQPSNTSTATTNPVGWTIFGEATASG